jgi:hypothetical protein
VTVPEKDVLKSVVVKLVGSITASQVNMLGLKAQVRPPVIAVVTTRVV